LLWQCQETPSLLNRFETKGQVEGDAVSSWGVATLSANTLHKWPRTSRVQSGHSQGIGNDIHQQKKKKKEKKKKKKKKRKKKTKKKREKITDLQLEDWSPFAA
jgi:uncharacterized membrane protein YcgQ (UPF0703/DUF1980 family)